ncbi:MAG: hypothetical protein LM580_11635 [Thermofilum sp.]|nr:hypothetical protein [Thermofilum sp.]
MPSECERLLKLGFPRSVLFKLHKVLDNAADAPDRAVSVSSADLFAALRAVGCPLLALLLTDFHPLDPVEERIVALKLWLCTPSKNERGASAALRWSTRGSSCTGAT